MRLPVLFSVLLFTTLTVAPALAKTGYVTDQLVLTLRSAPKSQSEVLDHLRTGSSMEILTEEGKYLRVRTKSGKEGFVLKQYVTDQTPKAEIIARQKKEIDQLREQLKNSASSGSETQQQVTELQQANADLETRLTQAKSTLDQVTEEHQKLLDASGNLLQTTQQRDELIEENQRLATEAATLRDENNDLLTTGSIKWFLAGAGVLFFGWFMGKISRKKRRPF